MNDKTTIKTQKFIHSRFNITRPKPWVSFGGSYPGSLSAWLKLKYPHLMSGSVSSSGPLFAKVDFFEYLQVVHDAIKEHSHECMHEGVGKNENTARSAGFK